MSDAPETIWVNINDSEDGCCPVEDEHLGDGRFYDPDTATEYRRADLPPHSQRRDAMSEIDRAMLQSMAASFRGALEFSFDRHDMAELMDRCASRADLAQAAVAYVPEATLSAAMELPEVKALVVALEYGDRMCRLDFHREINPDDECFSQAVWDTWQRMVAAIAAIKETKT